MSRTIYLNTPLDEESIRDLKLNDVVYLSGTVYAMMFQDQFKKLLAPLRKGEPSPIDLNGGVIYHTGTIFRRLEDGGYDFRAIGATTSCKFNEQTPELIRRLGVRMIIGKGGMGKSVLEAMKECGCAYLSVVGGCSAIYTPNVVSIEREYWPQKSWAKNALELKVEKYGPLFVAMDANGNSVFEMIGNLAQSRKTEIYKRLGIEAGK